MDIPEPTPGTISAAFVAMIFAIGLGGALSDARNEAAMDLGGACWGLLGTEITNVTFLEYSAQCVVGGWIYWAIPGTIGVFLLVYSQLK